MIEFWRMFFSKEEYLRSYRPNIYKTNFALRKWVNLRPKMFFALLIFCIRQVCSPAGWVHNMHKTSRWRLQFHEKTGNGKRFENRGHLDAEQRGAAAHGTVSIACSSPLLFRPLLRTWRWLKEHLPLNLQTSESLSPKDLFPILTSPWPTILMTFWCILT